MPKLEFKVIQRELEQQLIWPFYWIYGTEKFKLREILEKIRAAVLPPPWGEVSYEASETSVETVLDAVRSPPLGGGIPLIWIRDAHLLKNPELLSQLLGPSRKKSDLDSVCVCISKDLDGRKKFSKILLDQAAVIACDEVGESQREAWVQSLAKRRNLNLDSTLILRLCSLDPWTLDILDQELEKYVISNYSEDVLLESSLAGGGDLFLESFFSRDRKSALYQVAQFAQHADESFPLLGLLGWNVRHLVVVILDQEKGTHHSKLSGHLSERFRKWSQKWELSEVMEFQKELAQIDFHLKQSPSLPLGLWSSLVIRFCH